jgi:hypothetical protein
VITALRDGLPDSWFLIPTFEITIPGSEDRELDVICLNEQYGIIDLEVKGHQVTLREGTFYSGETPLNPQPDAQAKDNAYSLRARITSALDLDRREIFVDRAIAFPNVREIIGSLPPSLRPEQVITATGLASIRDTMMTLVLSESRNRPLGADRVQQIIAVLCPTADLVWDPSARAALTRQRLDDICAEQVAALATLDTNRRVAVTGSAGTGKTRLAAKWARQAWQREERVLLTCYNEPLASQIREDLGIDDEDLVVGAFLSLALSLDGMAPIDIPVDAGDDFWNVTVIGHLLRHWHEITETFDTIIIDEAQDFSPAWLAALEALLDQDGPRRVLLVADERQLVYRRGFSIPRSDDGWVRAELPTNCRNAHEIAHLLRMFLDGAPAPSRHPEAHGISWIEVADENSAVEATRRVLADLDLEGISADKILVETVSSDSREALRSTLGLVPFEQRGGDRIVCENVHRSKGLEFDVVVLVIPEESAPDSLLYIGISRAVTRLILVSSKPIAARLRLDTI